jgi:hypothetical protein
MEKEINQNNLPVSVDPSGIWRFWFWFAYVLGTLVLLFTELLLMAPGRPDFVGDLIIRTCAASLMLISILMGSWIWKIRNPLSDQGGTPPMRVVLLVAWLELGVALYALLGRIIYKLGGF